MSQWGNTDDAANSVSWGPSLLKTTANTTTQTALYGNTTANAFITNLVTGQFGVSTDEMQAARASGLARPTHAGWNLRVEGQGGRAGRVSYETLVAMNTITGDGTDDSVLPDYTLQFILQPEGATGNSAADESVTFEVDAASVPTGASISYLWQYTTSPGNTETFATTVAVGGFSNQTTNTLTVNTAVIGDGTLVRARISATGATNVFSDPAELTVTV